MSFTCPICTYTADEFYPCGFDIPVNYDLDIVGTGHRKNAVCPLCMSKDRDRLIYLMLKNERLFSFGPQVNILHIAPERTVYLYIATQPHQSYICGDLNPQHYRFLRKPYKIDLLNIKMPDKHFDYIVCNHVLEHIPDDMTAMKELYRVLKPGGKAILQVPISFKLEKTFEDLSITDPKEREKAFGQFDHVRVYARDYKNRLESAGFSVEITRPALSDAEVTQYALNPKESVYVASRS